MLPARALFYAIVVSLMTAIVSGLLISLSSLQSMQQTDQFRREQTLRNMTSGLAILKGDIANIPLGSYSLYDEEETTIQLEKYDWGLFKIGVISTETFGLDGTVDTLQKTIMLGAESSPYQEAALWLSDQNKPLSLTGSTKIKGTAYVPKSGVERGFIPGAAYQGATLISGTEKKSNKSLPKLNLLKLEQLLTYQTIGESIDIVHCGHHQPFNDVTLYLGGEDIVLDNCALSGRIVIEASRSITVLANSLLKNVILVAPEIQFESGCNTQVQAFANQKMEVGENCLFTYPSILGMARMKRTEDHSVFKVGTQTQVSGLVFSYDKFFSRTPSIITIEEEVEIQGQVYSNGKVDLRGKVYGSVITKNFFLNTGAATYDNFLLSATIDRTRLSEHYLSPLFLQEADQLNLMQWLD